MGGTADASKIDAFLMICEILRPVFDALDDESGFHGLDCSGNCETVGKARKADRQCSKFASH